MKTVLLPLLILGLMFYLCYQLKLDFVVADWLYQLQGSRWVFSNIG
jgi:membrane-associated PAP2 superfamily phosphatase